jgi:protein tyrosine phosphatase
LLWKLKLTLKYYNKNIWIFSAGVGRTGSYISIDINLKKAKAEGCVDVLGSVWDMRADRISMVQTLVISD